jgi:hypothetical protein
MLFMLLELGKGGACDAWTRVDDIPMSTLCKRLFHLLLIQVTGVGFSKEKRWPESECRR